MNATDVHEAGHAVAAVYFGATVTRVCSRHVLGAAGFCEWDGDLQPRDKAVVVLSGSVAEKSFLRRRRRTPSYDSGAQDRQQLLEVVSHSMGLEAGDWRVADRCTRLERVARGLVVEHWWWIERVAVSLSRGDVLTGSDVARLRGELG